MFRPTLYNRLKPLQIHRHIVAGHKNWVKSPALIQLEQLCEQYCHVPRIPPRKVTVIGAGSDVGRIVCMLLKQQKVIRTLAMYDEHPARCVIGVATDIAHIDTSPAVEAYQGRTFLKKALNDADVVLICGGAYVSPPCCNILDRDLFFQNMPFVRSAALASAEFAPHAIVAVQTPPVDANFTLVKYTMKAARRYNKRKVLGINSVSSMRANQLFCAVGGMDPTANQLPVVCGTGRCTRVPCFSVPVKKPNSWSHTEVKNLTRLVREADELICKVKSNYEQGHLSIGFATARFVTCLMKGLFEGSAYIDSALVEQGSPSQCFNMKYCSTPVNVSKGGISQYLIPKLDGYESSLLEDSKLDLEDMLNLGRCFASGDDYYLPHEKVWPCLYPSKDCPVVEPCGKKAKN
ncbi:unnamed protein product [Arctia plantaginis]|uniref:Malate dehydrogenase, mitochondrial n=1 Tax=Arctia plantaginis TaxID=874455 RepID=A0A8S1AEM3_ARCPL|nr:unnamed protein product [Arctia plantaginis]